MTRRFLILLVMLLFVFYYADSSTGQSGVESAAGAFGRMLGGIAAIFLPFVLAYFSIKNKFIRICSYVLLALFAFDLIIGFPGSDSEDLPRTALNLIVLGFGCLIGSIKATNEAKETEKPKIKGKAKNQPKKALSAHGKPQKMQQTKAKTKKMARDEWVNINTFILVIAQILPSAIAASVISVVYFDFSWWYLCVLLPSFFLLFLIMPLYGPLKIFLTLFSSGVWAISIYLIANPIPRSAEQGYSNAISAHFNWIFGDSGSWWIPAMMFLAFYFPFYYQTKFFSQEIRKDFEKEQKKKRKPRRR